MAKRGSQSQSDKNSCPASGEQPQTSWIEVQSVKAVHNQNINKNYTKPIEFRLPRELGEGIDFDVPFAKYQGFDVSLRVTKSGENNYSFWEGLVDYRGDWTPSLIETPLADEFAQNLKDFLRLKKLQDTCDQESSQSTSIMSAVYEAPASVTLPSLPKDWQSGNAEEQNFKSVGSLSSPVVRGIQPIGPHFLAHARRKRQNRTFSEDERIQAQERVKKVEDDEDMNISEDEDPMMLQRDAKDWKGQDHYAVLGLKKYRYKATPEQIKKAHRKKVLRHHPDKKAAAGKGNEDDSFFKCIQKATEILTDPQKRREWDSVDEAANVQPPSKKDLQKGDYFKQWRKFFNSEARFSNKKPVPEIGNADSTKEEVEEFYDFWYTFDSWRTFEYLNEDVPDDNENRDHKRHVEKKNANARRKHKSEDIARLRQTVDACLAGDERIKKFQQAKSQNKNKKRLEKEAETKRLAEEAAAAKAKEEEEAKAAAEAAKANAADAKKNKDAAKTAVKKNRRVLKGSVKDVNYFAGGEASASQVDNVLGDVELIQGKIDPEELADLVSKLSVAGKDSDKVKGVWEGEAKRLVGAGKAGSGDFKALAA